MAFERIKNGTFDADIEWDNKDLGGGTSIIGGGLLSLAVVAGGESAAREQEAAVEADVLCNFTMDTTLAAGAATLDLTIGSSTGASDILNTSYATDGAKVESFTPTVTTIFVRVNVAFTNITNWSVDNVSILQAGGNFPNIIFIGS